MNVQSATTVVEEDSSELNSAVEFILTGPAILKSDIGRGRGVVVVVCCC